MPDFKDSTLMLDDGIPRYKRKLTTPYRRRAVEEYDASYIVCSYLY